jgi:hypothetical protein
MAPCCPPSRGCNAPDGDQPCALRIFTAAAGAIPEAGLALARWDVFQRAAREAPSKTERRFRRRAYERARDRALRAVAMEYGRRRRRPGFARRGPAPGLAPERTRRPNVQAA